MGDYPIYTVVAPVCVVLAYKKVLPAGFWPNVIIFYLPVAFAFQAAASTDTAIWRTVAAQIALFVVFAALARLGQWIEARFGRDGSD